MTMKVTGPGYRNSGMFQLDICSQASIMLSHQHMHTPHPPLLHPKKKKANESGVLLEIVSEMFWLDTKSTCSLEQCNLSTGIVTWNCATPPGGTGMAVRQVGQVRLTGDTLSLSPLSSEPV